MIFSPEDIYGYIQLTAHRDGLDLKFKHHLINISYPGQLDLELLQKESGLHKTLIVQIINVLLGTGVIIKTGSTLKLDHSKLINFYNAVDFARGIIIINSKSNDTSNSLVYTSPPEIIPHDLASRVDDIRNLILSLVTETTKTLTILSPYTTTSALNSILEPIYVRGDTGSIKIRIYIDKNEQDAMDQINDIKKKMPIHINANSTFFYRGEGAEHNDILHAKVLLSDSRQGYLGSANFTAQGFGNHFELGIKIDSVQTVSIERLLNELVTKGVFKPLGL